MHALRVMRMDEQSPMAAAKPFQQPGQLFVRPAPSRRILAPTPNDVSEDGGRGSLLCTFRPRYCRTVIPGPTSPLKLDGAKPTSPTTHLSSADFSVRDAPAHALARGREGGMREMGDDLRWW